jgi:hypothetical protein
MGRPDSMSWTQPSHRPWILPKESTTHPICAWPRPQMTQAGKPVTLAANLRIAAPVTLWP